MAKYLYLMRHGQTLFNLLGKIQGSSDSPLTDLGIEQAQIAGRYFKENGITFDAAVTSTQERAVDTLENVTDMPYTRLKGIKEWNFGLFEAESERLNPKPKAGYTTEFVPYGGESHEDVTKRMVLTLSEEMKKVDKTLLAVSHGGASLRFTMAWYDCWNGDFPYFSNCCIQKFKYEDGSFTLLKSIDPINSLEKVYTDE